MTSKSASATFADGAAFISLSRAAWAALDATENPRMRDGGAVPCADNKTTPVAAAHNASTPTRE
jgi:hypothetical protein